MIPIALEYPLGGNDCIPQNHGYELFAALCRLFPWMHDHGGLQIAPINGIRQKDPSLIQIADRSVLHVRGLTQEESIQLIGKSIHLKGAVIPMGSPTIRILQPLNKLASRLVILDIDNFAGNLMAEIAEKLGESPLIQIQNRRALNFKKGTKLLGYSVEIRGLTREGAATLLKNGLGKCRTMGCGVFRGYL